MNLSCHFVVSVTYLKKTKTIKYILEINIFKTMTSLVKKQNKNKNRKKHVIEIQAIKEEIFKATVEGFG